MCRSFLLLAFLGVLFTSLYSKTAAKRRLPEDRKGDKNFCLSCLLFDDIGCDLECRIVAKLYNFNSRGKCVQVGRQKNICECKNQDAPIHPYIVWKKKFDSDDVYNSIMTNTRTALEVIKILDEPKATGEELKILLRPLLSPYQYSKLKVNDNSPAAKFIKNDEVDRESVQKFVSDQLDELLTASEDTESSNNDHWNTNFSNDHWGTVFSNDHWGRDFSYDFWDTELESDPRDTPQLLLHMDYRSSFKKDLFKVRDNGTLYNFVYKVTGLGNETLEKILEEYLRRYNVEKPALKEGEDTLVANVLHYTIVNELIKRNDATPNSR